MLIKQKQSEKLNLLNINNMVFLADSILIVHKANVACKDENNHLCILPYEEAKSRNLTIISKCWFKIDEEPLTLYQDGSTATHLDI